MKVRQLPPSFVLRAVRVVLQRLGAQRLVSGVSAGRRNRYTFTVNAVDTVFADLHAPDRVALERAMRGHVLASAQLVGYCAGRAGG